MKTNIKGSRVKFIQDGKLKRGTVTGSVPTLWGGALLTVKVGQTEITLDEKNILK